MNTKRLLGIAKWGLIGTLGVAGIHYASDPFVYREFELKQRFKEKIKEEGSDVRKEFERQLDESVSALKTADHYVAVRSSDWCMPCKSLEQYLQKQGLLSKTGYLDARNHMEEITSRIAFERLGVDGRILPTIVVRRANALEVYTGAKPSDTDPSKFVTFNAQHQPVSIDSLFSAQQR